MVPTQIWGGYPRGGVGVVGFDEVVGVPEKIGTACALS